MKNLSTYFPALLWILISIACAGALFRYVDLKPQMDENFFFSSDDPNFQDDKKILATFPQPPQIILAAKGDIHSKAYLESIEDLSRRLESRPEVFGLQSLTRGPSSVESAISSPLWKRMILTRNNDASFLFAFLKNIPGPEFIVMLENLKTEFKRPGFELMISGIPYISELIRRNLCRDLQIFSLAAFAAFSFAIFWIFGSFWIVGGVIMACFDASAITLFITQAIDLQMGFLTTNLPTIIFVLTLSHIAFLTADWKDKMAEAGGYRSDIAWKAAKETFEPALWSTMTALLGFLTLLFVPAKSLKQLGISGSIGTVVALVCAYGIYPWFLARQNKSSTFLTHVIEQEKGIEKYFAKNHTFILFLVGIFTALCFMALPKLNTDPSLSAYFKEGGEIRNGLEFIDENGGSNPLNLVIHDPAKAKLNSAAAYKKMWRLHNALEKDPAVGHVVSLVTILAEAKQAFIAKVLPTKWLVTILESPRFGEVSKYFVTADRDKVLFFLRMRESDRHEPRLKVVDRIKETVKANGYEPILVGGVFPLQGRLSELVASSLISGAGLLNLVVLVMVYIFSRSFKISIALLISLYFVPICMMGILSFLKIPLDVISAPAANIAMGMGVDSMIHLTLRAKHYQKTMEPWDAWVKACGHLLAPIGWSTLMVASGFSIFMLSNFPPTQRFGFSVVLGTLLTPIGTLFILPRLATLRFVPKVSIHK